MRADARQYSSDPGAQRSVSNFCDTYQHHCISLGTDKQKASETRQFTELAQERKLKDMRSLIVDDVKAVLLMERLIFRI